MPPPTISSYSVEAESKVNCCQITQHDDHGAEPIVAAGVEKAVNIFFGQRLGATLTGLSTPASAVAVDRSCRRMAAGTEGGSLRLWDVATGEQISGFNDCRHRTMITSIHYHPFADFLATASRDTHVRIWDLRRKSTLQVYKHKDANVSSINVVRIAPDGLTGVSGDADGVVRLYDLRGGKVLGSLDFHRCGITSLAVHPSRQVLGVASGDGVVSLWDMQTQQMIGSQGETGCTHVGVVQGTFVAIGSSAVRRYALPSFKPAPPAGMKLGDILDVYTDATDHIYAAGANNAVLNVMSMAARGSGTTATTGSGAGGVGRPGAVSAPSAAAAAPKPRTVAPGPASAGSGSPTAAGARGNPSKPLVVAKHDARDVVPSASDEFRRPLNEVVPSRAPQVRSDLTPAAGASPAAAKPKPAVEKKASPTGVGSKTPSAADAKANRGASPPPVNVDELVRRGETMASLMERRATHIRMLRTLYQRRAEDAFNYAKQLLNGDEPGDSGAVVDLLAAIASGGRVADRLTLDTVPAAIQTAEAVLERHNQSPFVVASVEMARVVWVRFNAPIREALRGARVAVGVDLSLEERVGKCKAALRAFEALKDRIAPLAPKDNEVGAVVRKFLEAYGA